MFRVSWLALLFVAVVALAVVCRSESVVADELQLGDDSSSVTFLQTADDAAAIQPMHSEDEIESEQEFADELDAADVEPAFAEQSAELLNDDPKHRKVAASAVRAAKPRRVAQAPKPRRAPRPAPKKAAPRRAAPKRRPATKRRRSAAKPKPTRAAASRAKAAAAAARKRASLAKAAALKRKLTAAEIAKKQAARRARAEAAATTMRTRAAEIAKSAMVKAKAAKAKAAAALKAQTAKIKAKAAKTAAALKAKAAKVKAAALAKAAKVKAKARAALSKVEASASKVAAKAKAMGGKIKKQASSFESKMKADAKAIEAEVKQFGSKVKKGAEKVGNTIKKEAQRVGDTVKKVFGAGKHHSAAGSKKPAAEKKPVAHKKKPAAKHPKKPKTKKAKKDKAGKAPKSGSGGALAPASPSAHKPAKGKGEGSSSKPAAKEDAHNPALGKGCRANNEAGICKWTSNCNGKSYSVPEHCPGPANLQCCVAKKAAGGSSSSSSGAGSSSAAGAGKKPSKSGSGSGSGSASGSGSSSAAGSGAQCTVNGMEGTCMATSKCGGKSFPGRCKGPANIECCVGGAATGSGSGKGKGSGSGSGSGSKKGSGSGSKKPSKQPSGGGSRSGGSGGSGSNCLSVAGLALFKSSEGFRPNFYLDEAGQKTIGYGTDCNDENCKGLNPPISEQKASDMMLEDLERQYAPCVRGKITRTMSPNQFSALMSFVYNLGCSTLDGDVLAAANANNGDKFAELISHYNHARDGPNGPLIVLAGLTTRRRKEGNLFKSGGGTCAGSHGGSSSSSHSGSSSHHPAPHKPTQHSGSGGGTSKPKPDPKPIDSHGASCSFNGFSGKCASESGCNVGTWVSTGHCAGSERCCIQQHTPAPNGCGTNAVARARTWSNMKLQYCQSAEGAGDGGDPSCSPVCNRSRNRNWDAYRSDCSGFVSWAYGLSTSYYTGSYAPYSTAVSSVLSDPRDMRPGDVVNSIPSEHIMIFVRWLNDQKSMIEVLQEPGCSSAEPYAKITQSPCTIAHGKIHIEAEGMTFYAVRLHSNRNPC